MLAFRERKSSDIYVVDIVQKTMRHVPASEWPAIKPYVSLKTVPVGWLDQYTAVPRPVEDGEVTPAR